jgi:phage-related protein
LTLGTAPTCITGVLIWTHGQYNLQPNGSIVLTPFGDGYQQVQDPCAGVSNFVQDYNNTELISYWRIFLDSTTGGYKLHLWAFDGTPMAPQFQVSSTPNMLPTQRLRNVTTVLSRRSFFRRAIDLWSDN